MRDMSAGGKRIVQRPRERRTRAPEKSRYAPPRDQAIGRIGFESNDAPSMLQRGNSSRATAHERVEHESVRRTVRENHALDDLQRLLRRVVFALRVLSVQPGHAPDILGVISDLEPFLSDKDRPCARSLRFGIVGYAYGVDIEEILPRS